ncbi:MAG: DUF4256 domain-containing protein [Chitinophagales bacterium]
MKKELSAKDRDALIEIVHRRFAKHMHRHKGITWDDVLVRLEKNPKAIHALQAMEETGGEPDVIERDKKTGAIVFYDCAEESPKGRRSYCYDYEALMSRKEHKPKHSALEAAAEMGIELLDEEQYKFLQQFGPFDNKTSSWVRTPDAVRELGGAIFGDCRFGRIFIYHNGAESYYAARGFRGRLVV